MEIIFGTEGWRGQIADTFTITNARIVTQAMADDLLAQGTAEKGVVIGYDTRFLSDRFARECALVLTANGIPVYLMDRVVPTPLLSFAVRYLDAAMGVMVTASHNPAEWNGIKWKGPHAGPIAESDVRRIARFVGQTKPQLMTLQEAKSLGLLRTANCVEPYVAHMMRFLTPAIKKKRPLHVVVDTMHGAAGAYFAQCLQEIGCRVTKLRAKPDPTFGGVHPEPIKRNLSALIEKVRETGADLGVATDGDGDRLGAVDEQGHYVSPQVLFALLTRHLLAERNWTGSVVKTFSTTRMIDKIAQQQGATVKETPIGFKHICDRMQKEHVLIGGEESGGIGIPRHMPERDGIFAALLLIEHLQMTGQSLGQATAGLMEQVGTHEYDRIDLHVPQTVKEQLLKQLRRKPRTFAGDPVRDIQTTDGIKYLFDHGGWLLFRPSGTEPLLRIYAEGTSQEQVSKWLAHAGQLAEGTGSRKPQQNYGV